MTALGCRPSDPDVRVVALGSVALAGCILRGGATVGWRSGGGTVGWYAGGGAQRAEIVAGESYGSRGTAGYGGVAAHLASGDVDPDGPVDRAVALPGVAVGASHSNGATGFLVGAEGLGFAGVDPDTTSWGVGVGLGIRLLGSEVELYGTAQLVYLTPVPDDED